MILLHYADNTHYSFLFVPTVIETMIVNLL